MNNRVPLAVLDGVVEKQFPKSYREFKEKLWFMYLLATETMNTRQDIALAYYDKTAIDNIIEGGSCMYILIPHSRRVNLAPQWYGAFKVVEQIHPVYRIEVLSKNDTKLLKFMKKLIII